MLPGFAPDPTDRTVADPARAHRAGRVPPCAPLATLAARAGVASRPATAQAFRPDLGQRSENLSNLRSRGDVAGQAPLLEGPREAFIPPLCRELAHALARDDLPALDRHAWRLAWSRPG